VSPGQRRTRAGGTTSSRSSHTDVVIVEAYVPEYRRRFFELLEVALAAESIRLTVATGSGRADSARGDATELALSRPVPELAVSIRGRRLGIRRLSHLDVDPALVVVDQALRHLENYPLLLRQRRGPRVALWGHGTRRVTPANWLERTLERRVTRLAHWFFAYTQSGADDVARYGFPPERITIVQNTLDVGGLAALRNAVSPHDVELLRHSLDLHSQQVACLYIGALDNSKRIPFLLEACTLVAQRDPNFVLVVAGDGDQRHLVKGSLASRPWLRYVGRALGTEKARLGAVSDVLLMPGRVGLVAVDSFALRTPILTTRWAYHAPEVDYLEDGVNACFSGDTVEEYADMVANVLRDPLRLERLQDGCAAAVTRYSIEAMVANFAGGVVSALAVPRR
jgi:glycosyltransferase involved in cell wall biosynthesis